MSAADLFSQLLQTLLAIALAPLALGWVNQCRAWLQNRRAPALLQPYRLLAKLLLKDAVPAHHASWLFRLTPYVVFGCMVLAASIVPLLAADLPFSQAADVIALVGLFALARVFMALAAMDLGTAFGSNFAFFGKFTFVLKALGGCSGFGPLPSGLVRIST